MTPEPVNVTLDIASYNMPVSKFIGWIRDGLGGEFEKVADDIAAQIEEQSKPTFAEPTEWGGVVMARRVGFGSEDTTMLHWQRHSSIGDSWISEPAGDLGVRYRSDWSYLRDVEVLRFGIGSQHSPSLQQIRDLLLRSPSGVMTNEEIGAAYKELRKGLSGFLAGES